MKGDNITLREHCVFEVAKVKEEEKVEVADVVAVVVDEWEAGVVVVVMVVVVVVVVVVGEWELWQRRLCRQWGVA